ncbi:hypothetical protein NDU88_005645 [Pleurodeles waltl]|uniref:Uncharacterized protein n=1 Tax=Pleurodeles waltl TaxID=8319 RepID=A0AAV7L9Z3_PLEWA|nr:hypothetical protein NDU88_005645 [Pleurodeles waltl]
MTNRREQFNASFGETSYGAHLCKFKVLGYHLGWSWCSNPGILEASLHGMALGEDCDGRSGTPSIPTAGRSALNAKPWEAGKGQCEDARRACVGACQLIAPGTGGKRKVKGVRAGKPGRGLPQKAPDRCSARALSQKHAHVPGHACSGKAARAKESRRRRCSGDADLCLPLIHPRVLVRPRAPGRPWSRLTEASHSACGCVHIGLHLFKAAT